jgi:galactonate dehydratase
MTDVKTYLVAASRPGGWAARNWCIAQVHTNEGLAGIRGQWLDVRRSDRDRGLQRRARGENPGRIERLWQKLLIAMMGHGMTGVVGAEP